MHCFQAILNVPCLDLCHTGIFWVLTLSVHDAVGHHKFMVRVAPMLNTCIFWLTVAGSLNSLGYQSFAALMADC